jgi:hypothetical protein
MGGFRPIQVVEQMVCRFSRSQGQKADLFSVSLGRRHQFEATEAELD